MHKLFGLIIAWVFFTSGCAMLAGMAGAQSAPPDLKARWKTIASKNLVRYRVSDLGLDAPAALSAVELAAQRRGLELCPEPLGIPIRLAYPEQPDGEALFVGMKPVTQQDKTKVIYRIRIWKNERHLDAVKIEPGKRFDSKDEFIFVRPKRVTQ